jgi:lysophospholipase
MTLTTPFSLEPSIPLADGRFLYLHSWVPEHPLGRILMIHGKGDYGRGFEPLGQYLSEQGWACYAPDMIGFGRSPGKRCWVNRFSDYQNILKESQQYLSPHIWCGYSTGANWILEYALQYPKQVQALILISPALSIDNYFTPFTLKLLWALDCVLPQLVLSHSYNPAKVTSVPERQAHLAADPFICGTTRVRFVAELVRSGQRCLKSAQQLKQTGIPVLILQAGKDRVVNSQAAQLLYEELAGADVTLHVLANSAHDLIHDVEAQKVKMLIGDWLDPLKSKIHLQ